MKTSETFPALTQANYAAAARVLVGNLQGLVRNESVQPYWIGDSGRFWYCRDGQDGPEFVVVTADGAKSPAFDHEGVARALATALGNAQVVKGLPASLAGAQLNDDLTSLSGQIAKQSFECDLKTLQCRLFETPLPAPEWLPSPDARWAALARGHNLFVRDLASGAERQLTHDGAPFYSWAKLPDNSMTTVLRKRAGLKTPPFDTHWSPDGRYLIAPRIDERTLGVNPMVEWVPTDGSRRPIVHEVRLELIGDRETTQSDYFLIDLVTGGQRRIEFPPGYQVGVLDGLVLDWSHRRGQAFLLARTRGSRSVAVLRLDLASADLTCVVEESSTTHVQTNTVEYNRPNIRLLGDGAELIWYSTRSGWGHLYLYDAQSGDLKNAITHGEWLVQDIQAVDEARREIYFTASGREAGRDPYYRHLYRSGLDAQGTTQLLTAPDADHHFEPAPTPPIARMLGRLSPMPLIHPAAGVFVDTWSTVDEPPVSALRSTRDGRVVAELERADAGQLFAAGWRPPVRERVKAADGTTDLYAVYYSPVVQQAGTSHPAIDEAYGGPQVAWAPKNFTEAYRGGYRDSRSAPTHLGFGVIIVDGRGTPQRSRAFQDAGYPEFTQVGIDDHVAAIRELARRHPEIDLERIGVRGWSWGGTFAAQAVFSQPQFYKVAVSGAGVYDYAAMYAGFEAFVGPPVYANGLPYRSGADETPENWRKLDITRLADRLEGHVLIAFGDMDENVPPQQALRLVDALTRANKPYDLVYLPNRTHAGLADGYMIKRTWDYFIEHLLGAAPVRDFKVQTVPPR